MLKSPLSVDIAVIRYLDKRLQVLLVKRDTQDAVYPGQWALAGGLIEEQDSDMLAAVSRTLVRRIGSDLGYIEQVATYASATRDPRGWSITTLHLALVAPDKNMRLPENVQWFDINHAQVRTLAFDHSQLLQAALERLKNKATYSILPAYLLAQDFTYSELQEVYECILESRIDKSKFRTKLKNHPDLILGEKRTGVAYRSPVSLRISQKPKNLLFDAPFI